MPKLISQFDILRCPSCGKELTGIEKSESKCNRCAEVFIVANGKLYTLPKSATSGSPTSYLVRVNEF